MLDLSYLTLTPQAYYWDKTTYEVLCTSAEQYTSVSGRFLMAKMGLCIGRIKFPTTYQTIKRFDEGYLPDIYGWMYRKAIGLRYDAEAPDNPSWMVGRTFLVRVRHGKYNNLILLDSHILRVIQ